MSRADRTNRHKTSACVLAPPMVVVFVYAGSAAAKLPISDPIIGAANGKVYHTHPDCYSLKKIAAENRVTFGSVAMAEAEGRRQCKTCEKLHAKDAATKDGSTSNSEKTQSTQPSGPKWTNEDRTSVRVKTVLPGGTLILEKGEKATLVGVCFPLVRQEGAKETVRRVEERVSGVTVLLVGNTNQFGRDSLGRMRVSIQPSEGRPDLGAELIAEGLAWCDSTMDFSGHAEYLKKEKEAWEKGKGIWKRLDGGAGKREVLVGRYAAHYHPVDCRHEAHLIESNRITLNEAKARRLTPCDLYRTPEPATGEDASVRRSFQDKGTHEEKE